MKNEPVLAVKGLDAFYGRSHVLQGVEFEMGNEPIAIIGRNGMGKTTLCKVLMGMSPPSASGSARFEGEELIGRPSYRIADAGLGYVPQGRRLFPSLSVDEHLRMIKSNGDGRWMGRPAGGDQASGRVRRELTRTPAARRPRAWKRHARGVLLPHHGDPPFHRRRGFARLGRLGSSP